MSGTGTGTMVAMTMATTMTQTTGTGRGFLGRCAVGPARRRRRRRKRWGFNLCVEGKSDECPDVQALIDYLTCGATNLGGAVASISPCTQADAIAAATTVYAAQYMGVTAACYGVEKHVRIVDGSVDPLMSLPSP